MRLLSAVPSRALPAASLVALSVLLTLASPASAQAQRPLSQGGQSPIAFGPDDARKTGQWFIDRFMQYKRGEWARSGPVAIEIAQVDLDGGRQPEYAVRVRGGPSVCDAYGCPTYVFMVRKGEWVKVFENRIKQLSLGDADPKTGVRRLVADGTVFYWDGQVFDVEP